MNREEATQKAKAQLDEWDAELKKLDARMREAHADSSAEMRKQVEAMRERRDQAEARLKEMREASDDAWQEVKLGLDKAWQDLSTQFEAARERMTR